MLQVALKVDSHRLCEPLLNGQIRYYHKAPGLAVVRGRGKGGRSENVLDNGIGHRVRFEAADRAARSQEAVQISCERRSELV